MSFFQVIRPEVSNVISGITQQKGIASGLLDTLKSYVPKVQTAWIGGDADFLYQWGLAHKEADVRLQTLWLIGHRRDASTVKELSTYLKDQNPGIRTMAAWAIIHSADGGFVGGVET